MYITGNKGVLHTLALNPKFNSCQETNACDHGRKRSTYHQPRQGIAGKQFKQEVWVPGKCHLENCIQSGLASERPELPSAIHSL